MRGILAAAGYVPYRRLQRSAIRDVMGSGGGKGTRSVASFDEDTTTMAVEAARNLGPLPAAPTALWFATAEPAYLDKTNANAIHAALRLDSDVAAMDMGGAIRSGIGALRAALESTGTVLLTAADVRTGLPGGADETNTGDGAAAALVGDGDVIAEYLGGACATREFLERWRTPGSARSKTWEDRFADGLFAQLGDDAWNAALKAADVTAVDVLCVAGLHRRSAVRFTTQRNVSNLIEMRDETGDTGTAYAMLLLAKALEVTPPGQVVALVGLSDGADVLLFRAKSTSTPKRRVDAMVEQACDVPYSRFLSWRGMLTPEPPNRPEPARVSAPAAERGSDWKYGFVDDGHPLADTLGTIATFTVDRLAYSPSPPIVFAIVDFDGEDGQQARRPLELTDVDPDTLKVGDRVEMTFRKLSTSDGIHNYFWKARPVR
jgi:hydroxymethylglutaryl-CoA synthase